MADARSDRRIQGLDAARLAFGILAAAGALPLAEANSIQVTPSAALGGSRFGLELKLDDLASHRAKDAYVAIGPEKGLRGESSLEVGFTLDPSGLVAARDGQSGTLSFLRLSRRRGWSGAGLVVFIEQAPQNTWLIGAWSWDDGTDGFVLAGRAPLPFEPVTAGAPAALLPRIEIEWATASEPAGRARGYLRVLSVASDGERALLLENADLDNARQLVSYVQLGVVAADHAPGVSGRLLLDDFEINRTAPPLP
jgi:hypothetical protein